MTPTASIWKGRAWRAAAALGVIGIVAFQVGRLLRVERSITGGEICLPLDDSFIYLQYAKAIAEGHPFIYTPGNAPTTGATSLLYPVLLVPPHLLHLSPSLCIAWALALGAASMVACAFLVARLGLRLGGPPAALLAPLLLLGSPYLLWGFMSGMEIGVYAAVLLATVLAYVRERGEARFPTLRWWAFALALSRPEGAILAGLLGLGAVHARWRAAVAGRASKRWTPVLLMPLAAAALPFLVNLLLTGTIESTGSIVKSVLSEPHADVRARILRQTPQVWAAISTVYLSMFQAQGEHPLGRFVAANGAGLALLVLFMFVPRRRPWEDGRVLIALLPASVVVNSIPQAWQVHLFRYLQGVFPLILVSIAAGWGRLAWLAWTRIPRPLGAAIATIAIAAPGAAWVSGLPREQANIITFYGHNCENILHQQVAVGRWIDENLPRDAIVAMNDAGAIAYYGKRRTLDLVGLTTERLAKARRDGDGPLFEELRRLPPGRRPTYFAIYPEWFQNLSVSGLLGGEIHRVHLGFNTICGGTDKVVYPAVWIDVEPTDGPVLGGSDLAGKRLVDSLDLAWLADEARHEWHSYAWLDAGKPDGERKKWSPYVRDVLRRYSYADRPTRPVTDAGRVVLGGERFRVRLAPGRDAVVVMRTDAWFRSRLRVTVDGAQAGLWSIERSDSVWVEPHFTIPGRLITRPRPRIEIRREEAQAAGNYAPFHYWFYQ
jgi:hypothetical protein